MSDKQTIEVSNAGSYIIPEDWPQLTGDIDLEVQDRPHASSNTEWWYINGHVQDEEGHKYSLHIAFFRVASGAGSTNAQHLHACTANLVDVDSGVAHFFSYLDPQTPQVLEYQLTHDQYKLDPRLKNAMLEQVSRGSIPLPDYKAVGNAEVALDGLDLNYQGGNTLKKTADGLYHATANCPEKNISFDISLKPLKQATRQGNSGVVQVGIRQETMFYYFIPRNELTGTLTFGGRTFTITGSGWYDHEFGGGLRDGVYNAPETKPEETEKEATKTESDNSFAWNWFSMQLDNGVDITATNLIDVITNSVQDNFLITIGENSERSEHRDMVVEHSKNWISVRSGNVYPLHWRITSKSAEIDIELDAVIANQEVFTLLSRPAYWEGRLAVKGTIKGEAVTGTCFLERHGFDNIDSLNGFFKTISKLVLKEIHDVIPHNPSPQNMIDLLTNDENTHYLEGVRPDIMDKVIITPLREIVDRGGKSWRSYALLLCIDAVGGNSFKYQHWLAMPEMMHVGSLIIDDIQDKSDLRRGGPTCHKVHGESIAINAGTASYFLAMHILQSRTPDLTPEMRVRLYDLYFLTLRAGHCGQGFDIYGLDYRLEECIETGDTQDLLSAVIATHRLKSAVPAGNLARMGAEIGGGSKQQVEALGLYFESIGVAFQIIDDVLNLDSKELGKTNGEDLHEGKITYPVARAMGAFTTEQRKQFWDRLKVKPDYDVVATMINDLNSVGAIEASRQDATEMVENAFQRLDSVIPDSFYKIMLRAFGDFVLDRHY